MRRLSMLLLLVASACARPPAAAATSALSGTIDLHSFPSPVESVDALDEDGTRTSANVDAAGEFRLALPVGHHYRILVVHGWDAELLVFPRERSRFDSAVDVRGGRSAITLGLIRYVAHATPESFDLPEAVEMCTADSEHQAPEPAADAGPANAADAAQDGVAVPQLLVPSTIVGCADVASRL